MRKMLLERTKIGEFLSMEANIDVEDVDFYLYSVDISSSCTFKKEEWQQFVENVNKINQVYQDLLKKEG